MNMVIQGRFPGGRPLGAALAAAPTATAGRPFAPGPPRPAGPPPPAHAAAAVAQRQADRRTWAVDAGRLNLHTPGQKLPAALRARMEAALGADFRDVTVHVGPQAPALGALAFTMGTKIFFAPGQYDPSSAKGRELLGHELAHVVQQRQGRVRGEGAGVTVVDDAALEHEAERVGRRAAMQPSPTTAPAGAGASDALQRSAEPRAVVQRSRFTRWLRRKLGIGGGGGGHPPQQPQPLNVTPPPVVPLEAFVRAYEATRVYHFTQPGNLDSISRLGLLVEEDRRAQNLDVGGMSQLSREYEGDEKKGVFVGTRGFAEENVRYLASGHVRAFTSVRRSSWRGRHWPPPPTVPAEALVWDEKFVGGGMISRQSIPSERVLTTGLLDLIRAHEAGDQEATQRVTGIFAEIAQAYEGTPPDLNTMIGLYKTAQRTRRLSNAALDNVG